jgi:hypothetical protein
MKTITALLSCAVSCGTVLAAPFVNLTFDEPHTNAFVPNSFGEQKAPMADAIPGWTLEHRSDTLSGIYTGDVNALRNFSSIEPVVLLYPEANFWPSHGFSVYFTPPPTDHTFFPRTWFYQVGDVPIWAAQFSFLSLGAPTVRINGQAVPLTGGALPYEKVVDISSWAGQTVRLEFTAPAMLDGDLDIIGFSPVPEPSAWALLLLTLPLAFVGSRWHRRGRAGRSEPDS